MRWKDKEIEEFSSELVKKCMHSQKERITASGYFRQYYFSGSDTGSPALYNRCFPHVDRLSAYLFSPSEVHFQIGFDEPEKFLLEKGKAASRFLSYEFHRSGVDVEFADGVDWSLCKGSSFIKTIWGHDGLESTVVQPESIGVYREDINGLERQEAFNHQIFLTKGQFERLIEDHPSREEILQKVKASASIRAEDEFDQSYMHQMIIGGIQPITNPALKGQNVGMSQVFGGPLPILSPDVKSEIIQLNELWVMDDEREDWTTIMYVEPNIVIEGKLKRRNLTGIKGEQPLVQICPNRVNGYFWGRSELSQLVFLQDALNRRMTEKDRISRLRAKQPQVLTGVSGVTEQDKQALHTPGGFVVMASPTAKRESVAPDMPAELLEDIRFILECFDDVGGFEAITKGQGEAGVRSGVHAETLVRTATPRLRDRALNVERACGDLGDFCFKLLQNKTARTFRTKDGIEFLLDSLPESLRVSVDSHSSSPAFSQESKQTALELLKTGSIDAEDYIMLTHPPNEDMLAEKAEERAKAQSEEKKMMVEEAKKNPSLWSKILGKKK